MPTVKALAHFSDHGYPQPLPAPEASLPDGGYCYTYLTVGGGGGGGAAWGGGGGGGGGVQTGCAFITQGDNITVVIGSGGNSGSTGGTSQLVGVATSLGGGGGGYDAGGSGTNGLSGGSGGGGAAVDTARGTRGFGTVGQGCSGGDGFAPVTCVDKETGGGGGGYAAAGTTGTCIIAVTVGTGYCTDMLCPGLASQYMAGGGGGGARDYMFPVVQDGPDGAGATSSCYGGGGHGGGFGSTGGAGVVVIRYTDTGYCGYGGNIIKQNGYVTHVFTATGQFTANARSPAPGSPPTGYPVPAGFTGYNFEYLLVGGGGGGGDAWAGGGGGGGGVLRVTGQNIGINQCLLVTVGAGGAVAQNGSDSCLSLRPQALGGGGGGYDAAGSGIAGSCGASGGGASAVDNSSAGCSNFTAGQGNRGGSSLGSTVQLEVGGGGGGAGGAGTNANTASGGTGGAGWVSNLGAACIYGAGGGGGTRNRTAPITRPGGCGGSPYAGGGDNRPFANGVANSGSGGGGRGYGSTGGSGLVMLAYPDTGYCGYGGTISRSNGCIIHTFTGSGLFVANASTV